MQLNFGCCVELFGLLKYVHEFSVFVETLISNSVYLAILIDIKYCCTNQKQLTRCVFQAFGKMTKHSLKSCVVNNLMHESVKITAIHKNTPGRLLLYFWDFKILYQLYLLLVVCTKLPFVLWLRLTFDRIVQISL